MHFGAVGGTPTGADLCYFNIALPVKAHCGPRLAGEWAAQFTRDEGTGLQVRAGQELTHFKLLPGEEVRSPLVALVFWHGDWIDGQNVWRRWMIAHTCRAPVASCRLRCSPRGPMATPSNSRARRKNELGFMQQYYDLGWKFDYWWMDAGWYPFKTAGGTSDLGT